jgi:hypothetical protein
MHWGLVQYLRTIGSWIEDTNGNEIEETVLMNAIKYWIVRGRPYIELKVAYIAKMQLRDK